MHHLQKIDKCIIYTIRNFRITVIECTIYKKHPAFSRDLIFHAAQMLYKIEPFHTTPSLVSSIF